jgi:hypothetical protein
MVEFRSDQRSYRHQRGWRPMETLWGRVEGRTSFWRSSLDGAVRVYDTRRATIGQDQKYL